VFRSGQERPSRRRCVAASQGNNHRDRNATRSWIRAHPGAANFRLVDGSSGIDVSHLWLIQGTGESTESHKRGGADRKLAEARGEKRGNAAARRKGGRPSAASGGGCGVEAGRVAGDSWGVSLVYSLRRCVVAIALKGKDQSWEGRCGGRSRTPPLASPSRLKTARSSPGGRLQGKGQLPRISGTRLEKTRGQRLLSIQRCLVLSRPSVTNVRGERRRLGNALGAGGLASADVQEGYECSRQEKVFVLALSRVS